MTRRAAAAAVTAVLWSSVGVPARAQSISMELDATAGFSTEGATAAAGAQLRIFGDLTRNYRVNVETTWADRSADVSDAFGAAYPYGGRVSLSEAYVERISGRATWWSGSVAGSTGRLSASTRAATTPTRGSCAHR